MTQFAARKLLAFLRDVDAELDEPVDVLLIGGIVGYAGIISA